MPLYIVRWPNLSAAFVQADDEAMLVGILDEVANVGSCRWALYEGPFFLDLDLVATASLVTEEAHPEGRPVDPDHLAIGDVEALAALWRDPLRLKWAPSDTGLDTRDAVMAFAFPHTAPLLESEEPPDTAALAAALRKDAEPLLANTWRTAHLQQSDDPLAIVARMLDMPIEQLRRLQAEQAED